MNIENLGNISPQNNIVTVTSQNDFKDSLEEIAVKIAIGDDLCSLIAKDLSSMVLDDEKIASILQNAISPEFAKLDDLTSFQTKGNYLSTTSDHTTSAQASAIASAYVLSAKADLTSYYTKEQTNALSTKFRSGLAASTSLMQYESKDELTANYYTKAQTNALSTKFRSGLATTASLASYEPKTDLTANYYNKTQTNALSTTFRSGLATTASLAAYQPKGSYLSSNALGNYYTKSETTAIYSSLRNGLATADSLTAYEPKTDLTANYYNKTQTDAIFTSLKNSIATSTGSSTAYQPKGSYLSVTDDYTTSAQTSAIVEKYLDSFTPSSSGTAVDYAAISTIVSAMVAQQLNEKIQVVKKSTFDVATAIDGVIYYIVDDTSSNSESSDEDISTDVSSNISVDTSVQDNVFDINDSIQLEAATSEQSEFIENQINEYVDMIAKYNESVDVSAELSNISMSDDEYEFYSYVSSQE